MVARIAVRNILFGFCLLFIFALFLLYCSLSEELYARKAVLDARNGSSARGGGRPRQGIITQSRPFPQGGGDVTFDQPWNVTTKKIVEDIAFFRSGSERFIVGNFSYSNGLGNLMFQYASLRSLARRFDARLVLPASCLLRRAFDLDAVFAKDDVVAFLLTEHADQAVNVQECCTYRELSSLFTDGQRVAVVLGYLQSPLYFLPQNDFLIRTQFSFLDDINKRVDSAMQGFNAEHLLSLATQEGDGEKDDLTMVVASADMNREVFWVGIHVRHGMDVALNSRNEAYGQVAAPAEYYEKAMDVVRQKHDNAVFFVCSDNLSWARQHIKEKKKGEVFLCPPKMTREESLSLLARLSRALILSPGTFSWWSAFLSDVKEVYYYDGWPTPGSPLDRQLNRTEYYLPAWTPVHL